MLLGMGLLFSFSLNPGSCNVLPFVSYLILTSRLEYQHIGTKCGNLAGDHYVVDVNYFPSYKETPSAAANLVETLRREHAARSASIQHT